MTADGSAVALNPPWPNRPIYARDPAAGARLLAQVMAPDLQIAVPEPQAAAVRALGCPQVRTVVRMRRGAAARLATSRGRVREHVRPTTSARRRGQGGGEARPSGTGRGLPPPTAAQQEVDLGGRRRPRSAGSRRTVSSRSPPKRTIATV